MKVVFMGTPDFSVPVLEALVDAGHEVVAVYTQPPRPAGRGKAQRPGPVAQRAAELGLEVQHPRNFKAEEDRAALAALNADIGVVVAYGLILPQPVLDAPRYGCLNIHASLLPRWRGAAPIQRAIMEGDRETGVCIMQMEAGLDTGPVLMRQAVPIQPEDTSGDLHGRLSALGAGMIVRSLDQIDSLVPQIQPDTGVTYAAKIDKAEACIDWTLPSGRIQAHIHGLSPSPGAWSQLAGQRIKFLQVEQIPGQGGAPGTILDDQMTIACGHGALRPLRLQRAGKAVQTLQQMLNGFSVPKGTVLGQE